MKIKKLFALPVLMAALLSTEAYAQTEIKANGVYALVGVIDLSAEVPISPRLGFTAEILYSPWEDIKLGGHSRPEQFAYLNTGLRWYFKKTDKNNHRGWWMGTDVGAMVMMKMSRPYFFQNGQFLSWANKYEKGAAFMAGLTVGYKWVFGQHFTLEAYAGASFVAGWYNGYYLYDEFDAQGNKIHSKDEIMMDPHRPHPPEQKDPWNGSSNWIPRFGVNLGYKFL